MKPYFNQIARCKDDELRLGVHLFDYTLPEPVVAELKATVKRLAKNGTIVDWPILHHEVCVNNPAWPGSVPYLIVYRPFLTQITQKGPEGIRGEFRDWIAKPETIEAIIRSLENTMARMDYTDENEDTERRIWMIEWLWNVAERGTELMESADPEAFRIYTELKQEKPKPTEEPKP